MELESNQEQTTKIRAQLNQCNFAQTMNLQTLVGWYRLVTTAVLCLLWSCFFLHERRRPGENSKFLRAGIAFEITSREIPTAAVTGDRPWHVISPWLLLAVLR